MGRQGPPAKGRFWVKFRFSRRALCTDSWRGPPSIFKVWLSALCSLRHSRRGEREGVSGGAVRRLKNVFDTDPEDQGRSAEQGIFRGDVCYSMESVDLCDVM
jgi:hypothetical protein